VRRHTIGIIAVVLLLGAVALGIWPLETAWHGPLWAACCRLGPCLGALWLAYPQVKRLPAWLVVGITLLVVLLAVKPRWFRAVLPIAIPILIILAILKPRSSSRR
jgi:hypothetical protein